MERKTDREKGNERVREKRRVTEIYRHRYTQSKVERKKREGKRRIR